MHLRPGQVHSSLRGRCICLTRDRHKLGPEQGRRINLKGNVLSASYFGSNNWFGDVAAPRVLPDTSAVADFFVRFVSSFSSHLIFLQLSGCSRSADSRAAHLEFRSVGPEPMQDDCKAPRHRNLCPPHAPPLRYLHSPSPQPVPGSDTAQQYRGSFAQQGTHHPVTAPRDPAVPVGLSGSVFARCEAEVRSEQ